MLVSLALVPKSPTKTKKERKDSAGWDPFRRIAGGRIRCWEAGSLENTAVLCISADLPPTLARFCGAENLDNVITLSTFRNPEFGNDYGLTVADGPIRGLNSRSIIIIDENGKIVYTEQVPEIAQEPDYDAALTRL